mmetsp:Transcript_14087/g.27049  ORF Transcript_14087/g.27049 Transcript_14087/m.27049 type:complete len:337 (+) Transcript_14087:499-1509(+)
MASRMLLSCSITARASFVSGFVPCGGAWWEVADVVSIVLPSRACERGWLASAERSRATHSLDPFSAFCEAASSGAADAPPCMRWMAAWADAAQHRWASFNDPLSCETKLPWSCTVTLTVNRGWCSDPALRTNSYTGAGKAHAWHHSSNSLLGLPAGVVRAGHVPRPSSGNALAPSSELVYCSAASATPRSASFTVPCPSSVDSNLEPSQSCSEHLNLGPCAGPDWLMVEYRGTATRRAWHHSCKATLGLAGGRACWGMCLAGSRGCARSGSLSTLAATSIAMCAPRSSRNAFASSATPLTGSFASSCAAELDPASAPPSPSSRASAPAMAAAAALL